MSTVIYDFGANNGDDIPYYLLKADLVVAVEANPVLCDQMRERFEHQIKTGRVIVLCCVVSDRIGGTVPFYVHRSDHVLSQMDRPHNLNDYHEINVEAKPAEDIIRQFGYPYFIKIDIEGADKYILRSLLAADIKPPYISVECHDIEVLMLLVSMGGYSAFKYVLGSSVQDRFRNIMVSTLDGKDIEYSFPYNSAGPFGNDIDGDWWTPYQFTRKLCLIGTGWIDVHASNVEAPNPSLYPNVLHHLSDHSSLKNLIMYCISESLTKLSKRFNGK
jgi:FkbM family methyltransferase